MKALNKRLDKLEKTLTTRLMRFVFVLCKNQAAYEWTVEKFGKDDSTICILFNLR